MKQVVLSLLFLVLIVSSTVAYQSDVDTKFWFKNNFSTCRMELKVGTTRYNYEWGQNCNESTYENSNCREDNYVNVSEINLPCNVTYTGPNISCPSVQCGTFNLTCPTIPECPACNCPACNIGSPSELFNENKAINVKLDMTQVIIVAGAILGVCAVMYYMGTQRGGGNSGNSGNQRYPAGLPAQRTGGQYPPQR